MNDSIKILYGAAAVVAVFAVILFVTRPKMVEAPVPEEPALDFPIGTRYALGTFFRFAVPPGQQYDHAKGMIHVSNADPDATILSEGEYDVSVQYGVEDSMPSQGDFDEVFPDAETVVFLDRDALHGFVEEGEAGVPMNGYYITVASGQKAIEITIQATSESGHAAAEALITNGWLWAPEK